MSEIYVFAQDNEDWATIGECGALEPTSCLFEEIANGDSELTLEHPLDALGKYRYLQTGAVLKVEVPVRTTPEIENGRFVTSVEQWTVKASSAKAERYIYTKASGGSKKKLLTPGTAVIVTYKPAEGERWKVKYSKTAGYIASAALESKVNVTIPDTPDGMESALPSWEQREQLFRIYKITREDTGITASARHISYDLMYNLTTYQTDGEAQLQEALDGVLTQCVDPHDFTAATDILGGRAGIHTRDLNPIEAILDPEEGLAARWGAQLVRDDYELYLLSKAGANRGMTIEFARNLTGVDVDEDLSNVATCIRPVGENKNGTPLYLGGNGCVDGPLVGNYPFRRVHLLKCENCKVGTNNVTVAIAQQRMREQALALFEQGIDLPSVSAKVTFALLGHSERYAQYRELESVYLYDEIRVRHPRLGVDLTTQVVRTVWDCLRERMTNIELGSLQALTPSVAKWQVPSGISGAKIAQGTVGSAALANDVISARHMQAESVNADAIQANAVTADKVASNSIEARHLAAGAIDADKIKTATLEAMVSWLRTVTSESVTTDELAAQFARLQVIIAGTATFDQATIQRLVAEAMHLTFGEMGRVYIDNLMVNYAQMVSAAIGDLVVKASDGNYYHLDVAQDGSVTATQVTVTEGEINAGQTGDGHAILETDITATNLNTTNLFATYELVNRIDAARIDVDQLFAREAFLTLLRTSHIVGDKTLEIVVQDTEAAAKDAASARDAVDNLQVGGRNLLTGSRDFSGDAWVDKQSFFADGQYNGFDVLSVELEKGKTETAVGVSQIISARAGDEFTVSAWIKSTNPNFVINCWTGPGGDTSKTNPSKASFTPVPDAWTRYVVTFRVIADTELLRPRFDLNYNNDAGSGTMSICGMQLERGNRATDWTPAPEDLDPAGVQVGARNYLSGTATPRTASFNTPATANNFQTTDPYSTPGKKTLGELGLAADDQVTIRFDWQLSQNGGLPYTYGNFRAEWVGWKGDADNQYIATIQNPVAVFSANNVSGRATMTANLNSDILKAHTLRLRVDGSVLNLTISNCKLERGNRATDWTPAPEDVDDQIEDMDSRVNDCVTHAEQATYMRVVAPGENPATPPGVYVGLSTNGERPSTEAFIDASGWFRVLQNGVSITAMGPNRQEIGDLVFYRTSTGSVAVDFK